jgi:hypothetical protein
LVWFLVLLVLGLLFIAMQLSATAVLSFLETPLGQIFGVLFWVGLILVLVNLFIRRKQ